MGDLQIGMGIATDWLIIGKSGTYDKLFEEFSAYMSGKGLVFTEGKIIDASFVDAPRRRNTREVNNRRKSKVRCRIEHIFGFMEGAMGGLVVRSIRLTRAKATWR